MRRRGQRHRARPARSPNVSNRAGLAALGVPSKPPAPAADCVHWWLAAPGSIGPANRRKRSTEEVFIRELRNSEVAMLQSLAQELATRSALGLEAHWDLKRTGSRSALGPEAHRELQSARLGRCDGRPHEFLARRGAGPGAPYDSDIGKCVHRMRARTGRLARGADMHLTLPDYAADPWCAGHWA